MNKSKSSTKPRRRGRWLKRIGTVVGILTLLLALFVVGFVFNPFEGRLPDIRDLAPREVDFFVRKTDLAGDFANFPEPHFWAGFADGRTWQDLQRGPIVQGLRRDGIERSLQQLRDAVQQVGRDSSGFLDPMRDVLGTEVVLAGYYQDKTQSTPRPLLQPWWAVYARVTWRIRALWGLLQWSSVRDQVAQNGLTLRLEGPLLAVQLPGNPDPLYATCVKDCVMIGNSKHLLEQSLRLAEHSPDEEPFGKAAKYTDGVLGRLDRWEEKLRLDGVNALEFSISPNSFDRFQRFAASWPNPRAEDSMNERVLASFLNLKGWNSISGSLMFGNDDLSVLAEVVLNSQMHTAFQGNFFRADQEQRDRWLDKFLQMVPINVGAAVALRMPAGEFMDQMYSALPQNERDQINDALRQCTFLGSPLADARDLIDRLRASMLQRAGFIFRKNVPDPQIPVGDISPVPQIAWVFWIRPEAAPVISELIQMLRQNAATFRFKQVFHLKMALSGDTAPTTDGSAEDVVTEFTNPQIDGTGELACVLFKEFFVLSNSGPLIKDMFQAKFSTRGMRSILDNEDMNQFNQELANSLNGFVYLRGPMMAKIFEDYRDYAQKDMSTPDPEWMLNNRQQAEEAVRKEKYPQYRSLAAIPENRREEMEQHIVTWLNEEWKRVSANMSRSDLAMIEQFLGIARSVRGAYLQLELENNYIRLQGRVLGGYQR